MGSPSRRHKSGGGADKILKVLKPVSPYERSKEEMHNGQKAITPGQVFPTSRKASAADETHILRTSMQATHEADQERPRNGAWSLGATRTIPAKAHGDAEEAMPGAECHLGAPEAAFGGVQHCVKPERTLSKDVVLAEQAISKEDLPEKDKAAQEETLEDLSAKTVIKGFDYLEEQISDQYDKSMQDLVNHYLPQPGSDVASRHNGPTKDAEFFASPPRSATSNVHRKCNVQPLLPPAQLSTGHSILEAAAPGAPIQDGHAVTLKIINGSEILRSIVFITASTRTAILDEAIAYYEKHVQDNQSSGMVMAKEWDLNLVSLRLDGFDMDMSTYEFENLSFLIETIAKTEIPRFTLRVVEI